MTALLCWPATAQNGVTVEGLDVKPGTVTFNVSWKNTGVPDVWSDTVWVFVDYNNGTGKMVRLPLSPGATLTATSAPGVGKVMEAPGNDQGVWVVGNARSAGSFSATVQLLTATADLHAMCAYTSNYPPVGEYKTTKRVVFTGTPAYNLVLKHQGNATDTIKVSGNIYDLPENYTLVSFTDATGAPGNIKKMPPPPPDAASTQTWYLASLIWSDRIVARPSGCTATSRVPNDVPSPALYVERNGHTFYTSTCMFISQHTLCPYPWRMPTNADQLSLAAIATGSTLANIWGLHGFFDNSAGVVINNGHLWSCTPVPGVTGAYYYMHWYADRVLTQADYVGARGYEVRCVK
jgi:hypothetical protein